MKIPQFNEFVRTQSLTEQVQATIPGLPANEKTLNNISASIKQIRLNVEARGDGMTDDEATATLLLEQYKGAINRMANAPMPLQHIDLRAIQRRKHVVLRTHGGIPKPPIWARQYRIHGRQAMSVRVFDIDEDFDQRWGEGSVFVQAVEWMP